MKYCTFTTRLKIKKLTEMSTLSELLRKTHKITNKDKITLNDWKVCLNFT